ncbi:hypothetical protein RB195_009806 [Necator americanus]|uniref:Uncharacterized protein n=1 Tax=Necator americanus TaxID=51031 RepID=A0ABR1CV12_NECAM
MVLLTSQSSVYAAFEALCCLQRCIGGDFGVNRGDIEGIMTPSPSRRAFRRCSVNMFVRETGEDSLE